MGNADLEQEVANGGRAAVVVEQAGARANEFGASGVVLGEERGRGRDEGEVEVHEVLRIEELERLLEEVHPGERDRR